MENIQFNNIHLLIYTLMSEIYNISSIEQDYIFDVINELIETKTISKLNGKEISFSSEKNVLDFNTIIDEELFEKLLSVYFKNPFISEKNKKNILKKIMKDKNEVIFKEKLIDFKNFKNLNSLDFVKFQQLKNNNDLTKIVDFYLKNIKIENKDQEQALSFSLLYFLTKFNETGYRFTIKQVTILKNIINEMKITVSQNKMLLKLYQNNNMTKSESLFIISLLEKTNIGINLFIDNINFLNNQSYQENVLKHFKKTYNNEIINNHPIHSDLYKLQDEIGEYSIYSEDFKIFNYFYKIFKESKFNLYEKFIEIGILKDHPLFALNVGKDFKRFNIDENKTTILKNLIDKNKYIHNLYFSSELNIKPEKIFSIDLLFSKIDTINEYSEIVQKELVIQLLENINKKIDMGNDYVFKTIPHLHSLMKTEKFKCLFLEINNKFKETDSYKYNEITEILNTIIQINKINNDFDKLLIKTPTKLMDFEFPFIN